MKVAYGTLGWHPEYLQPVIEEVEDLKKVIFYYGFVNKADYKTKTLKSVEKMKNIFDDFNLIYEAKPLNNIFDFKSIVREMKTDLEKDIKAKNEVMLFNIAGGTKIMVAAALMVSLFKGIPALYYDEEANKAVRLPLLGIKYLSGLSPREKEIVQFIIAYKGETELTQTELARLLNVKKGTINPQIQTLEDKGIVEQSPTKDRRSKIVKAVDGIELLLETGEKDGSA